MTAARVLIAGGGPVGVTLALELALHGIHSLVAEAREAVPPNPRCNTTNARSMELLRRLGAADLVRHAGLPLEHSADVVCMTAMNGHEIVRFARGCTAPVLAGTARGIGSDWPTPEPQHFISQLYKEPALRLAALARPEIDLRLGWEMLTFTQDGQGVTARLRHGASAREETLQAEYLVGADGSASRVRQHIGARLEGIGRLGDACSVFIRAPRLTELYRQHPAWMYRFIGGVIVVAINGVDEWLVHTHPADDVALADFDYEPVMFAAIGERFDYALLNVARWSPRALVANTYREGRVFLAGDAAHIWIPMGGFGMNAGMADAQALGWRLGGVLNGWLHERVLNTYEQERKPMGAQVTTQAVRWGAELRPWLRPAAALARELSESGAARAQHAQRLLQVNTSEWESAGFQLGLAYADSPLIAYGGSTPPALTLDRCQPSSCPGVRAPHVWRVAADGRRRAL